MRIGRARGTVGGSASPDPGVDPFVEPGVTVQQMHFCSGSVFATGDAIAMSLLRYVQAVATTRRSDVVTVPAVTSTGATTSVTLMVNGVSQISAEAMPTADAELEDDAFVARLEALTHELLTPSIWKGDDESAA